MKKLNLNIKLSEVVRKRVEDGLDKDGKPKFKEVNVPSYEVAIQWLSVMMERAINRPRVDVRTGRLVPTVEVQMPTQRKYGKVMDALEAHKEGIAEIEDDDFSFLDSKFHQAEISVERELNKILIEIDNSINQAKAVPKKE